MLGFSIGESLERLLIIGSRKSGKTSIAFHLATEYAGKCKHSLIICNKSKIETSLPLAIECTPSAATGISSVQYKHGTSTFESDPSLLSYIGMKYVGSVHELKAVFAGLHAYAVMPSLIIVEDFSSLVDPFFSMPRNDNQFLSACLGALAIMHDAIDYVNSSGKGRTVDAPLQLVITDNCQTEVYLQTVSKSCTYSGRIFDQLRLIPGQSLGHNQGQQDGGDGSYYAAIGSGFREIPTGVADSRAGASPIVTMELRRFRPRSTRAAGQVLGTVRRVVADTDPLAPIVGDGKKPAESLVLALA